MAQITINLKEAFDKPAVGSVFDDDPLPTLTPIAKKVNTMRGYNPDGSTPTDVKADAYAKAQRAAGILFSAVVRIMKDEKFTQDTMLEAITVVEDLLKQGPVHIR